MAPVFKICWNITEQSKLKQIHPPELKVIGVFAVTSKTYWVEFGHHKFSYSKMNIMFKLDINSKHKFENCDRVICSKVYRKSKWDGHQFAQNVRLQIG